MSPSARIAFMSEEIGFEEQAARKVPKDYVAYLKRQTGTASAQIESVSADVFPGVFRPATDAFLLGAHLESYVGSRSIRMLDTTSGSGILAVLAGSYGASGVAVDISPVAVENMRHNFRQSGVSFDAILSDVFDNVPPQKFDLIIANPPYLDGEILDPLDYAMHGATHFMDELLYGAHEYLDADGKMLVTYARKGLIEEFERKLAEQDWHFRVIDSRTSSDGERPYDLYEVW